MARSSAETNRDPRQYDAHMGRTAEREQANAGVGLLRKLIGIEAQTQDRNVPPDHSWSLRGNFLYSATGSSSSSTCAEQGTMTACGKCWRPFQNKNAISRLTLAARTT